MTTSSSSSAPEAMRAEVRRVAALARLYLEEEVAERIARDLGRILEYVRQLDELDLEGVEPTAHAMPVSNVFRPDEIEAGLSPEMALRNAPAARDGLFLVPRILE
ncbi:MAG: Asp-tRNA(Asn)/Glu-tRNA(Gln) amidotransferase subunit GatC [Kiritimatiellae bacterium]|nr:Asp-tRNA(Asn)/Glu-tRNA(Gln) amidotransferase subunit GatC [Kiritimatiellia bacterium]